MLSFVSPAFALPLSPSHADRSQELAKIPQDKPGENCHLAFDFDSNSQSKD